MNYNQNMGNCNLVKNYCNSGLNQTPNNRTRINNQFNIDNCNSYSITETCSNCSKYKDIAQKKCDQATFLSNEACQIANKATQLESQAKMLTCEANDLWKKYEYLCEESICLIEQAQKSLEDAINCHKNNTSKNRYSSECDCNCDTNYDCNCNTNYDCKKPCSSYKTHSKLN